MPTTIEDYHVNSKFFMGLVGNNNAGTSSGIAPATSRMMGKGFAFGGGSGRGGGNTATQYLMPAADIGDTYRCLNSRSSSQRHQQQSHKSFHRKSLGDWDFLDTVGAGSMGKVKLARHRYTNEVCAIKIVNRATKPYMVKHRHEGGSPMTEEEMVERRKKMEKDLSRDKRTIREVSFGQILYHPHICRLFEMYAMSNHYYMLFEYVSGGQLLDYIIQHGSLREVHARRFARGISSALQYLHMNNIVHRDLKIENIMISSSGEIKIIDFGLSNLYDPKKQLHTFCGSLYFAAPELLKADPYVGPEVDIWSFGVVLYVLVCGKVPFDDENASVLHEKIKKGKFEYPQHLSIDLVSLLSKMLVVEPSKRATLTQVIKHQWIQEGYDFSPPSYLLPSTPLKVENLSTEVIKEMVRLELAQDVQETKQKLTNFIKSDEYKDLSNKYWENVENGVTEENLTRASNPLISIYILVDEMLKRKRPKMKKLTSSHNNLLSTNSAPICYSSNPVSESSFAPSIVVQAKNSTAPSTGIEAKVPGVMLTNSKIFSSISKKNVSQDSTVDGVSDLGCAEVSNFNSSVGSRHTHNVLAPLKLTIPEQVNRTPSRKSNNDIECTDVVDTVLSPTPQASNFETGTVKIRGSAIGEPPDVNIKSAGSTDKQNFGFIFRKLSQRHRHTSSQGGTHNNHNQDTANLSHRVQFQQTINPTCSQVFSVGSRDAHSSAFSEYEPYLKSLGSGVPETAIERPKDTNLEKSILPALPSNAATLVEEQEILQSNLHDLNITSRNVCPDSSDNRKEFVDDDTLCQLNVPKGRKLHPSARAKSVGHSRRESLKFMRPAVPTHMYPHEINDSGFLEHSGDTKSDLVGGASYNDTLGSVDVELNDNQILHQASTAPPGSMPSIDYPRSLFLKGFFSVQTTSSKPLPIVRYKIIFTLKKLKIHFKEVKGGFVCMHKQSYMTTKLSPTTQPILLVTDTSSTTTFGSAVTGHRRQVSIPFRHGSVRHQQNTQSKIPHTPQATAVHERSFSVPSPSTFGGNPTEEFSTASLELLHEDDILTTSKAQDMNNKDLDIKQKERPPLKFEIHIVKVRIVGLAGVHFKKVSGNTWMYKELASHILKELNL